jgi:hypothetical protein
MKYYLPGMVLSDNAANAANAVIAENDRPRSFHIAGIDSVAFPNQSLLSLAAITAFPAIAALTAL